MRASGHHRCGLRQSGGGDPSIGGEAVERDGLLPETSFGLGEVDPRKAEVPDDSMHLEAGDAVLAILEPGNEDELRRVLIRE